MLGAGWAEASSGQAAARTKTAAAAVELILVMADRPARSCMQTVRTMECFGFLLAVPAYC
jgi:hypothetical protein